MSCTSISLHGARRIVLVPVRGSASGWVEVRVQTDREGDVPDITIFGLSGALPAVEVAPVETMGAARPAPAQSEPERLSEVRRAEGEYGRAVAETFDADGI